jgi:hypothetical protein
MDPTPGLHPIDQPDGLASEFVSELARDGTGAYFTAGASRRRSKRRRLDGVRPVLPQGGRRRHGPAAISPIHSQPPGYAIRFEPSTVAQFAGLNDCGPSAPIRFRNRRNVAASSSRRRRMGWSCAVRMKKASPGVLSIGSGRCWRRRECFSGVGSVRSTIVRAGVLSAAACREAGELQGNPASRARR